jgi:hypothetical protein
MCRETGERLERDSIIKGLSLAPFSNPKEAMPQSPPPGIRREGDDWALRPKIFQKSFDLIPFFSHTSGFTLPLILRGMAFVTLSITALVK